jgi:serine O-acetyltransferase
MKIQVIHCPQYIALGKSTLFRYTGKISLAAFLTTMVKSVDFKDIFSMGACAYLKGDSLFIPIYIITRLFHRRYTYKYGIDIPYNTKIDPGIYINTFGEV